MVEYGYDGASRLTEITYKQNGTTVIGNLTYEYDKNGNRIKTGGSFARTGIPQAVGTTAYNPANHQTTFGDKTLTYDNNGNLQTITDSSGTTTYTWNARNQLVGISGPGLSASFVYDGLGRRETKTINGNVTRTDDGTLLTRWTNSDTGDGIWEKRYAETSKTGQSGDPAPRDGSRD